MAGPRLNAASLGPVVQMTSRSTGTAIRRSRRPRLPISAPVTNGQGKRDRPDGRHHVESFEQVDALFKPQWVEVLRQLAKPRSCTEVGALLDRRGGPDPR